MGFHKTVLTLALIVFLIMIIFMAVVIKNSYRSGTYPPEVSKCPDYWDVTNTGCKATNKNKGNKAQGYETTVNDFDFDDTSNAGRIKKCSWARDTQVAWDGITNRDLC